MNSDPKEQSMRLIEGWPERHLANSVGLLRRPPLADKLRNGRGAD